MMHHESPRTLFAPMGFGTYITPKPDLVAEVQDALVVRGVPGRVLLAFNGGRAAGDGFQFGLNMGPRMAITSAGWILLDRKLTSVLASGPLEDIIVSGTTTDGVKVALRDGYSLRFFTGRLGARTLSVAIMEAVAHARLEGAGFPEEVPAQEAVTFWGTHLGGHGTWLPWDQEAVIALAGSGICVFTSESTFARPLMQITGMQVGGAGAYEEGGGWVGGGFGIEGALQGALLASVMNWATTRQEMDSLLRVAFDDAEATFALSSHAPGAVEIQLSATLAMLRRGASAPSALGLTPLVDSAPTVGSTSQPRFCGACGTAREQGNRFCTGCGAPIPGSTG